MLTFERAVARSTFRYLRRSGRLTRHVVVVGVGGDAASLCVVLDRHPELGYDVVGFLDDARPVGTVVSGRKVVLGGIDNAVEAAVPPAPRGW